MLRKRRTLDQGSTDLLPGQVLDRFAFEEENRRVSALGGKPATAEVMLLGITEASLQTESFLSAASFQKTTKVLTEAAIRGKSDPLRGLKENVIIGRLIPAGSGMATYQATRVGLADPTMDVRFGDADIEIDFVSDAHFGYDDVDEVEETEEPEDEIDATLRAMEGTEEDTRGETPDAVLPGEEEDLGDGEIDLEGVEITEEDDEESDEESEDTDAQEGE
jgi:hypothetical protein